MHCSPAPCPGSFGFGVYAPGWVSNSARIRGPPRSEDRHEPQIHAGVPYCVIPPMNTHMVSA